MSAKLDYEKQFRDLQNKYIEVKNDCDKLKLDKSSLEDELRKKNAQFEKLRREGPPPTVPGNQRKASDEIDSFIAEKDKLISKRDEELKKYEDKFEKEIHKFKLELDKKERQVKNLNNTLTGKAAEFDQKLKEKEAEISSLKRQLKKLETGGTIAITSTPSASVPSKEQRENVNPRDIEIVPAKTVKQSSHRPYEQLENINNGNNSSELVMRLEQQLRHAEQDLRTKNDEITRLKHSATSSPSLSAPSKSHKDKDHHQSDHSLQSNSAQTALISDLEAKLREANWRVSQLQNQNEFMNSKSSSTHQTHKIAEDQIENLSSKIRDLRRALEDLRYEKELADTKVQRMQDLEEQASELKQANRSLEEKIARLCEAPFINDAFSQQESRMRFDDALREREELGTKVEHLQEAVRMHFAALTALKQQAAQLRQDREDSERKLEDYRVKYEESEAGKNLLQDKLRLYSGDDGIDVESLERALTLVKRKSEALDRLPFLEDIDGDNQGLVTLPLVRRKLEEVQLANIRLSSEVENMEGMLKLQTAINRDLQKELEILSSKRDKDKGELINRCNDFEEVALKRLEKINRLENQLKQYVYNSVKPPGAADQKTSFHSKIALDDKESVVSDGDNALLRDWIQQCDDSNGPGALPSDENLMEVWVRSATFKEGVVPAGSSTFVVIDFFDCESQTTSIQSGINPKYDFAARYKVIVDDFYIRYLATDTISFDINLARSGTFSLLARVVYPVSALLRSRPVVHLKHHPIVAVGSDRIIGFVDVEMRLAIPISELYKLFLERHPHEKRFIEDKSYKYILENEDVLDRAGRSDSKSGTSTGANQSLIHNEDSRLYNELEVVIVRASGLKNSRDGKPPSAYASLQLLGFPEKISNWVANSNDPEFQEIFSFPVVTNDAQLRLLARSRLQMAIVDYRAEDIQGGDSKDDDDDGLIGEVFIPLLDLKDGKSINGKFIVTGCGGGGSKEGLGQVEVTVRWRYKFRLQREVGPLGLSAQEVECLLTAFSSNDDFLAGTIVDAVAFCRFMDPPRDALRAMEAIRKQCFKLADARAMRPTEILRLVLAKDQKSVASTTDNDVLDKSAFVDRIVAAQFGVIPSDLFQFFEYADLDEDNYVSIQQLQIILSIGDDALISDTLRDKLRNRAIDLRETGVSPAQICEESSNMTVSSGKTNLGPLLSRSEFKTALKRLGFHLADEGDLDAFENAEFSNLGSNRQLVAAQEDKDLLNDTMDSSEDIIGANPSNSNSNFDRNVTFERQKNDIEMSGNMRLEEARLNRNNNNNNNNINFDSVQTERDQSATQARVTAVGKNMLDTNDRGNAQRETLKRPTSKSNNNNNSNNYNNNNNADIMDSINQGFSASSSVKNSDSARNNNQAKPKLSLQIPDDDSKDATPAEAGPITIYSVEDKIRSSIDASGGLQAVSNLLDGFLVVDLKRTQFVNRQQFAHVLKQFTVLDLEPLELRCLMDFFDTKGDGARIDYNSFVRFVKFSDLTPLPAVQMLNQIVFTAGHVDSLRRLDKNGTGFLKRPDVIRFLGDLGYTAGSASATQQMMELFETKVPGQIAYGNFCQFIRDNPATRAFEELSNDLLTFFVSKDNTLSDAALKHFFKLIEKNSNTGKFNPKQLAVFLAESRIPFSKASVPALYGAMADHHNQTTGRADGISYSTFAAWARAGAARLAGTDAHDFDMTQVFGKVSSVEMRKKAQTYLALATSPSVGGAAQSMSMEDVVKCFEMYDWRKSAKGEVSRVHFIRAMARIGFVFTKPELQSLCDQFTNETAGDSVLYRKFVGWCNPQYENGDPSSGKDASARHTSRRSVSQIARYLENCVSRGLDLNSVFARYDSQKVGRITANDFCAAMGDLNLDNLTKSEALEFAGKFQASLGELIVYRRIVSEIIRIMDDNSGSADVDIVDVIISQLKSRGATVKTLRACFSHYDRKSTGLIDKADIGTVFEESVRISLKRSDTDELAKKFAALNNAAMFDYNAFIRVLLNKLEDATGSSVAQSQIAVNSGVSNASKLNVDFLMKLRSALEHLIIRGKDFRMEFDKVAEDKRAILITKFRDVMLNKLDLTLSEREYEVIERYFKHPTVPKAIDYIQFLNDCHPRTDENSNLSTVDEGQPLWSLAETLRNKVRRKWDYNLPGELLMPYRHFNPPAKDSPGIFIDDLAAPLRLIHINCPRELELPLFKMMAISGGSYISYSDFIVFICDPFHQDIVWKFRRSLSRASVSDREIIDSMAREDINKSRYLSTKQFTRAMNNCNIDLSDRDIMRLLYRFDVDDSQRICVDKFILFLQNSKDENDFKQARKGGNGDERRTDERSSIGGDRDSRDRDSSSPTNADSMFWKKLCNRIEDKLDEGLTLSEIFALFDTTGSGELDLASLQYGANELGISMDRSEARIILRRLTSISNGPVNKATFFESLGINPSNESSQQGRGDRDSSRERDGNRSTLDRKFISLSGIRDIVESVKQKIEKSANGKVASEHFAESLSRYSSQRSGYITLKEMGKVFEFLDARLSRSDVESLYESIDVNMTGSISIEAALKFIYPPRVAVSFEKDDVKDRDRDGKASTISSHSLQDMKSTFLKRPDLKEVLLKQFTSVLVKGSISELSRIFKAADIYGYDRLERQKFANCLGQWGIELKKDFERDLVDSLAEQGKGEICYKDFIIVMSDVVAAANGGIVDDKDLLASKDKILNNRSRKTTSDIERQFTRQDMDGNGTIKIQAFETVLEDYDLSSSDIKKLTSKFSINSKEVDLVLFIKFLKSTSGGQDSSSPTSSKASIQDKFMGVLSKKFGSRSASIQRLEDAFDNVRPNTKGRMTSREFRHALEELKVDFNNRDDVELLFSQFDLDKSGTISISETLKAIENDGKGGDDATRACIKKLQNEIGSSSQVSKRLKEVFLEKANRDGKVSLRDFTSVLHRLNLGLSEREITALFNKCKPDRDDLIDYRDFIDTVCA